MVRRILVPLDGSRRAENALPFAQRLALLFAAELHLLRVNEAVPHGSDRLTLDSEEEVVRYLERIRTQLESSGVRVRWDRAMGAAHEAIETYVRGFAIDLVAMATHGAGKGAAQGFGSVALKCLRVLTVPMYIIRAGDDAVGNLAVAPRPPERILVPLDGSPLAQGILTELEPFLKACDAEVRLLRVVPFNTILRQRYPGVPEAALEEAQAYVTGVAANLRDRGVRAGEPRTVRGDPAAEITKAAQEGVDLVAMCTHGRSGFSRWFFGSVAEKVLAVVRSPMLLMRARG